MKKIIKFKTLALGSEPATPPDIYAMREWIAGRHGKGGDLILFHLQQLLGYQREQKPDSLCAGGFFYKERLLECLNGIDGGVITGELDNNTGPVRSDIKEILYPGDQLRMAIPAPAFLRLHDNYFGDPEEAQRALIVQYRLILREMRDSGIKGHVMICEHTAEEELESFSGKKFFWFIPQPGKEDLEQLLEHQNSIAVPGDILDLVIGMIEEFPVKTLIITRPTPEILARALRHWDYEHIVLGGYCREYHTRCWEEIVRESSYQLVSE